MDFSDFIDLEQILSSMLPSNKVDTKVDLTYNIENKVEEENDYEEEEDIENYYPEDIVWDSIKIEFDWEVTRSKHKSESDSESDSEHDE